jgi:hypothetical protein
MDSLNDIEDARRDEEPSGGRHSHWLMIACCVPLVLAVLAILAFGASAALLLPLIVCVAMMAFMMIFMMRG